MILDLVNYIKEMGLLCSIDCNYPVSRRNVLATAASSTLGGLLLSTNSVSADGHTHDPDESEHVHTEDDREVFSHDGEETRYIQEATLHWIDSHATSSGWNHEAVISGSYEIYSTGDGPLYNGEEFGFSIEADRPVGYAPYINSDDYGVAASYDTNFTDDIDVPDIVSHSVDFGVSQVPALGAYVDFLELVNETTSDEGWDSDSYGINYNHVVGWGDDNFSHMTSVFYGVMRSDYSYVQFDVESTSDNTYETSGTNAELNASFTFTVWEDEDGYPRVQSENADSNTIQRLDESGSGIDDDLPNPATTYPGEMSEEVRQAWGIEEVDPDSEYAKKREEIHGETPEYRATENPFSIVKDSRDEESLTNI